MSQQPVPPLPSETQAVSADSMSGDASSTVDTPSPGVLVDSAPKPPSAQNAIQQSISRANLETEVGQVLGTFNSWWGGVKKQSASAISSIKADLDKTVVQAQADLEYLRTAKVEIVRKTNDSPPPQSVEAKAKGKEKETAMTEPATNTLLDRITSSTSQLQHTLQTTFQNTLASAAANPALANPAQLRTQLAENLRLSSAKENLQLSVKQAEKMAEEYLRKGDQWVKDAEKWMGDAVKVVPPDEGSRFVATSWDGGDFYAFSTSSSPKVIFDTTETPRPSTSAVIAGSRKDTLLSRLREDQDLLLVDPQGSEESQERRQAFAHWVEETWPQIHEQGKETEIGYVGGIRMALVPEHLSDEQFWQRYLFHKDMIEAEDEKRKRLLEATQESQADDFSWDDDPEESPSSDKPTPKADSKTTSLPKAPSAVAATEVKPDISTSTSPRDSEESYDVISDTGPKAPVKVASNDDEDSDWE